MPFFLGTPGTSVCAPAVVFALFPPACILRENSEQILVELKVLFSLSSYCIGRVKAERAFRLYLGPFCKIQRSTFVAYLVLLVDNTIKSLLLDS